MKNQYLILFILLLAGTVSCKKAPVQTEPSHKIQLKRPDVTGTGIYLREFKIEIIKNSDGNIYFTRNTQFYSNTTTDIGGTMQLDPLYDNDSYTMKIYNEAGDTLIATNNLVFNEGDGIITSPLILEPGLGYTVGSQTGSDVSSNDHSVVEYLIYILE